MRVETLTERAARQARQLTSARVTRKPSDACSCVWCTTRAPRSAHLLVNVPSKSDFVVHAPKLSYRNTKLGGTRA